MTGEDPKQVVVDYYLTGRRHGPPTLDDILAMFRRVTGREPSPEEIDEARVKHDMFLQTLEERGAADEGHSGNR